MFSYKTRFVDCYYIYFSIILANLISLLFKIWTSQNGLAFHCTSSCADAHTCIILLWLPHVKEFSGSEQSKITRKNI